MLGDIQDQASIDQIAQQCKVVIATAGPFARHGTAVVDACVRTGADYCDCTGTNILPKPMSALLVCTNCCYSLNPTSCVMPAALLHGLAMSIQCAFLLEVAQLMLFAVSNQDYSPKLAPRVAPTLTLL